eukprot:SAG22_NODE_859_length_6830_cov_2.134601_4_plen_95_part_00
MGMRVPGGASGLDLAAGLNRPVGFVYACRRTHAPAGLVGDLPSLHGQSTEDPAVGVLHEQQGLLDPCCPVVDRPEARAVVGQSVEQCPVVDLDG